MAEQGDPPREDAAQPLPSKEEDMANQSTLISLAMLSVKIDREGNYMDYLRPFAEEFLRKNGQAIITSHEASQFIERQFGLIIPARVIESIFGELLKRGTLAKEGGARGATQYRIIQGVPESADLMQRATQAGRRIRAVLTNLVEFSQEKSPHKLTLEEAEQAVSAFLSEFSIESLKMSERGTAIPDSKIAGQSHHVILVSKYVRYIESHQPERFEDFVIMLRGSMLTNALLCSDLAQAKRDYRGVTFLFDTPFIINLLGLAGQAEKNACEELMRLLSKLKAKFAIFSHTRGEIEDSIHGAAAFVDHPEGHGSIVREARRRGWGPSKLLLHKENLDEALKSFDVAEIRFPDSQEWSGECDENFRNILSQYISYHFSGTQAKDYDVESVRGIYSLRGRHPIHSVEGSRYTFVTTNKKFASAARQYMRHNRREMGGKVPSVLSDFDLANAAWLKLPLESDSSLPRTELLSYAYAAMEPTQDFWETFLEKAEDLEKDGFISADKLQALRLSPEVPEALTEITEGDVSMLQEKEGVRAVVKRIIEGLHKDVSEEKRILAQNLEEQSRSFEERGKQIEDQEEQIKKFTRIYNRIVATVIIVIAAVFPVILWIFLPKDIFIYEATAALIIAAVAYFIAFKNIYSFLKK